MGKAGLNRIASRNAVPERGWWNAAARTGTRRAARILFGLVWAALTFRSGGAQTVDEYQMKAAFLFNFAKFVEWPAAAFKDATDPIGICVLGDSSIIGILEQAASGKAIDGRRFTVRQVSDVRASCHILFVSASGEKHWRLWVEQAQQAAILTVGETDGFVAEGGVINLRIESGRVRMQINPGVADRAKVHISAKLLSLAQIVR